MDGEEERVVKRRGVSVVVCGGVGDGEGKQRDGDSGAERAAAVPQK